jgi:hypothetical protein
MLALRARALLTRHSAPRQPILPAAVAGATSFAPVTAEPGPRWADPTPGAAIDCRSRETTGAGSGWSAPRMARNLSRMNTYAKSFANPCGMCTYKIIGLKVSCNEHLRKNGGGGVLLLPNLHPRRASARRAHIKKRPLRQAGRGAAGDSVELSRQEVQPLPYASLLR